MTQQSPDAAAISWPDFPGAWSWPPAPAERFAQMLHVRFRAAIEALPAPPLAPVPAAPLPPAPVSAAPVSAAPVSAAPWAVSPLAAGATSGATLWQASRHARACDVRMGIEATARHFSMTRADIAHLLAEQGLRAPPIAFDSDFIARVRTHAFARQGELVPVALPDLMERDALAAEQPLGVPSAALRALAQFWREAHFVRWSRPAPEELPREKRLSPLIAETAPLSLFWKLYGPRICLTPLEDAADDAAFRKGEALALPAAGMADSAAAIYETPLGKYAGSYRAAYNSLAARLSKSERRDADKVLELYSRIAAERAVPLDYAAMRILDPAPGSIALLSLAAIPPGFAAMVRRHDQLGGAPYPRPFVDLTHRRGIYGPEPGLDSAGVHWASQPHPHLRAIANHWRSLNLVPDWPPQKPLPPDLDAAPLRRSAFPPAPRGLSHRPLSHRAAAG